MTNKSGVCRELRSSFIRHCRLSTTNLRKIFVFSTLLSKDLSTFVLVVSWLNYDLHVVFYV